MTSTSAPTTHDSSTSRALVGYRPGKRSGASVDLVAVLVFALSYVLISLRKLDFLGFDRPAGALLGAVLMVALGVLSPEQAARAVDGSTLLLLFGVMGMGAFLALDGFFERLEQQLVTFAKTPARLLGVIVWGAGVLSAFITNDAVCVLGAPPLVRLIQRHKLAPLPFLLALATAANTGSVATLIGNPQNMLCGRLGNLSYRDHLWLVGPIAIVALAINHAILLLIHRKALAGALAPREEETRTKKGQSGGTVLVIFATAVACTWGASLPWAATSGFVVLMLLHRRDTSALWGKIDWSILLFFAGLFVVVEGFVKSGAPALFFARFPLSLGAGEFSDWLSLSGIFLLGSNVVSNVPFIMLIRSQMSTLSEPTRAWELLAVASTFAGNLTLLGSVANIIVAESARELGGMGFWPYLKTGALVAIATTWVGVLWLYFAPHFF